jgi:hypothetical protein
MGADAGEAVAFRDRRQRRASEVAVMAPRSETRVGAFFGVVGRATERSGPAWPKLGRVQNP